jgi:hypothetical protein
MHNIFMFFELLNNTFSLFINIIFQSCKIILEYFSHTCVYFCLVLLSFATGLMGAERHMV